MCDATTGAARKYCGDDSIKKETGRADRILNGTAHLDHGDVSSRGLHAQLVNVPRGQHHQRTRRLQLNATLRDLSLDRGMLRHEETYSQFARQF